MKTLTKLFLVAWGLTLSFCASASAPFDGYPANTPPDQMLYYGGFHKHTSYEQAGYSDTNSDYRQDYDSMQASGFMISTNNALGPGHSICLLYTSPSPRD